jgi:diaminopimelate decarboxylase
MPMLWPLTTERDAEGGLHLGGVPIIALVERFGTPLYVFDETTLRSRARAAVDAFARAYPRSRVRYAGKALLSLPIVKILRDEGLGLDVVSGGELYAGLRAGVAPEDITFHGNNKSEQELREAIAAGIGLIAVDNHFELTTLTRLTGELGTTVPVLLRLNPGVDVHTHAKIKTGAVDSKFGFPVWTGDAASAVECAVASPGLDLVGYHAHLGSQLFDADTMRVAIETMIEFAVQMRERHGVTPREISPGGGFGVAYTEGESDAVFDEWAKLTGGALTDACRRYDLPLPELVVEPGRSIVGPAAVAIYRVGAIKEIAGVRCYVAVDGGMADNIRPSLYGARYTAALANRAERGPHQQVTIAGKFCESGDILIDGIDMPAVVPGDLLAIPVAGAYCLAMASNYNHALRPAVVLVNDGAARLIRRRETYEDLVAMEVNL